MDVTLNTIIDKYWEDFVAKRDLETTIKPSIPIIWFGDLEGYKKSSKKIVTISLNPSNNEFKPTKKELEKYPELGPFLRFPKAEKFYKKNNLNDSDKKYLVSELNNYFRVKPYDWFDHYKKIIKIFDASYKDGNNTAIHIDIRTAIATDPVWSEMKNKDKKQYKTSLVKDLLDYLDPDIIFYSSNKEEFDKYFKGYNYIEGYTKNIEKKIESFDNIEDERKYGLHGSSRDYIRLYTKGEKFLIWGKKRQNPFNGFTNKIKQEVILPSIRDKIELLESINRQKK